MRRIANLFGLWGLLALAACVSIAGGPGGISPSQFQFVSVLPSESIEPGGWKMARVTLQLVHMPEGEPVVVPCDVQVEVPEINKDGVVTHELAQTAAAQASDTAAARVMDQGLLSAELCVRFRAEMLKELQMRIPGARVRSFKDLIPPPRRR